MLLSALGRHPDRAGLLGYIGREPEVGVGQLIGWNKEDEG